MKDLATNNLGKLNHALHFVKCTLFQVTSKTSVLILSEFT